MATSSTTSLKAIVLLTPLASSEAIIPGTSINVIARGFFGICISSSNVKVEMRAPKSSESLLDT